MLTTLGIRVDESTLAALDALLAPMQDATPYATLSRGDVVRACLAVGIRTIQHDLETGLPGAPVEPGAEPDLLPTASTTRAVPTPEASVARVSPEERQAAVDARHLVKYGHIREPGPRGNCLACDRLRQRQRAKKTRD